jgi:CheY-like chemotaxis protein
MWRESGVPPVFLAAVDPVCSQAGLMMTTVLLADDQLELRSIHSAYLQSHGFRVITADDGQSALDVARSQHPDVIVLDQSMPHRTGVEVARELQLRKDTSTIPIIMLTAHTYGAVGKKAREAGCVSVLTKPCPPSRVLLEIGRHVRERTATAVPAEPDVRPVSVFRTRRYGR